MFDFAYRSRLSRPSRPKRRHTILHILACGLAVMAGVLSCQAATLTVTNTGDSGPGSLRDAIATAASGDTILFQLPNPSVITLQSALLIFQAKLNIQGPGATQLAISGNQVTAVFFVNSGNVNISGLTIEDGFGVSGGGITNYGTLTLTQCTISGNVVRDVSWPLGAGIYNGGTLTVINSTISGNHGAERGGGIYNAGNLTVLSSTFSGNSASAGGGIDNFSSDSLHPATLAVINSTFSGNSGEVAAIADEAGTATITNSTITGNSAAGPGFTGGVIGPPPAPGDFQSLTLINTIIANNVGNENCTSAFTDGGYNLSDDATCGFTAASSKNSDTHLNLGTMTSSGVIPPLPNSDAIGYIPAGINGCGATVTTDQIGQARPGSLDGKCTVGAYEVVAPVSATITNCASDTQLQSVVSAGGRIVFACSGDIPLSKTLNITQNTMLDATGQIVTLDGQKSVRVLELNGGLALTLNNLTVANGSSPANDAGGGLRIYGGQATAVVGNATFSGNSGGVSGGAIFSDPSEILVVTNASFVNNSATDGGAIYSDA